MIGFLIESLATKEIPRHLQHLSRASYSFASQIHNPIPSLYTQNCLQLSTANLKSSKLSSMADVVGHAAQYLAGSIPPSSATFLPT
jgi:hypothetical protein